MSGMDISKVFGLKKGCTSNVKDLVNLAKLAESAERFEDMCDIMAELVDSKCSADQSLTVEERNLLSVAYKNVVGSRRASLRNLMTEGETFSSSMMETFKGQIQKELKDICDTILDLLTLKLIKGCTAEVERLDEAGDRSDDIHNVMEAKVFYLKMGADYYRYLAECLEDDESKENAEDFYKRAYDIAEKELEATHPIRLGLALNYSVCLYEIIKRQDQACDLAKKAFDEAISKLDRLQEADYKDSTLIMQLLRDNLTLWTAAEGDDDDDDRRRN